MRCDGGGVASCNPGSPYPRAAAALQVLLALALALIPLPPAVWPLCLCSVLAWPYTPAPLVRVLALVLGTCRKPRLARRLTHLVGRWASTDELSKPCHSPRPRCVPGNGDRCDENPIRRSIHAYALYAAPCAACMSQASASHVTNPKVNRAGSGWTTAK
jgi:hypothetical protein